MPQVLRKSGFTVGLTLGLRRATDECKAASDAQTLM